MIITTTYFLMKAYLRSNVANTCSNDELRHKKFKIPHGCRVG